MKAFYAALAASALIAANPALAHEVKSAMPAEKQDAKKATSETPTATPKPTEHSGGTDARGCHTNHSTGVYHCHTPK